MHHATSVRTRPGRQHGVRVRLVYGLKRARMQMSHARPRGADARHTNLLLAYRARKAVSVSPIGLSNVQSSPAKQQPPHM